jgi:hypothetical protein
VKYICCFVMLLLCGCGGYEDANIDKDSVKENGLMVPPCLDKSKSK